MRYATKDQAAYPALFSQRYAACVARCALAAGLALTRRPTTKDLSLAMLGRQSKRHRPLVSEYSSVFCLPASQFKEQKHLKLLRSGIKGCEVRASSSSRPSKLLLPPGSALQPVSTPLGGPIPEAPCTDLASEGSELRASASSRPSKHLLPPGNTPLGGPILEAPGSLETFVKVGVYRTPEQFVAEAKKVSHPVDSANPLEKATLTALRENLTKDPKLVALKRNLALAKVRQEVKRHSEAESALHQTMSPSVAKVMRGKAILAFEALLKAEEYDDLGVIAFLKEGVRLVGTSECPECYDYKFVPAFISEGELLSTAADRREALLNKRERVDPEEARILQEATDQEVSLGFLEGPFYDRDRVSDLLGTKDWSVIRRFVLIQGSEQKPRPIDNCLEAQLNAGYSSSIHLRLQDSDYIASMALHVAKEVSGGRAHASACSWQGKCLDLSKAYKQLAIHPAHRPLAVIAVRDAEGRDALYVSNSLMFGSTAAVYAFNRVSRALWYLINRLLWIPSGVFYDDFPLLSPTASAENADDTVSAFLDALGWQHAKTGAKGRPFSHEFDVLGMCLNLEDVCQGQVTLSNKQGRIERIVDRLQEVSLRGVIRRQEAQVLQGLLQYASGFYAGRALKHASHVLARVVGGLRFSSSDLSDFCQHTVELLRSEHPRILRCTMIPDIVHLWTDGAWEDAFLHACVSMFYRS